MLTAADHSRSRIGVVRLGKMRATPAERSEGLGTRARELSEGLGTRDEEQGGAS